MKNLIKIIYIMCLLTSSIIAFEKDFNEKRHMIFTYNMNPSYKQFTGASLIIVDPNKCGVYLNVRTGHDVLDKPNSYNTCLSIGNTKKLNSFLGIYLAGSMIMHKNSENVNRDFQGVIGLVFNISNKLYIESGFESSNNSFNIGFGLSSILTRGVR